MLFFYISKQFAAIALLHMMKKGLRTQDVAHQDILMICGRDGDLLPSL